MLFNWDWSDVLGVVIGVVQRVVRLVINVMFDLEMALLMNVVRHWAVLVNNNWFSVVVERTILVNNYWLIRILMDRTVFMDNNWLSNSDVVDWAFLMNNNWLSKAVDWAFLMDNNWFSVVVDGRPSVMEGLTVDHGLVVRDWTVGYNRRMVASVVVARVVVSWCVVEMTVMDNLRLVVLSGAVDWIMVGGSVVGWLVVDWCMMDFSVVDLLRVDGLVVRLSVVDWLVVDGSVIDGLVVDRLVIEMLWMQLSNTRFPRKFWFKAAFFSIPVDLFVMRNNGLLSIFAVQSSLMNVSFRFLFALSLLLRFALAANRRLPRLQASLGFWQLVLNMLDTVVRWWMVHDWSFVSLHWIALNVLLHVHLSSPGLLLMQVELLFVDVFLRRLLSRTNISLTRRCWPQELRQ